MSTRRSFPSFFAVSVAACLSLSALACGDDESSGDGSDSPGAGGERGNEGEAAAGEGAESNPSAFEPQVPPGGAADMAVWLDAFEANDWIAQWVCEEDFSDKTDGAAEIHVHGANRVCNNQALAAASLDEASELPVGAAALKFVERGIYVEVKVRTESDGGDGWFWYAPGGAPAGLGVTGCTGCHAAAGVDADHPGLGDYVYFQVKD